MKIVMNKCFKNELPSAHLLARITKGKEYEVIKTYCKSRKITDDSGKEIWISNTIFKKFFKEI